MTINIKLPKNWTTTKFKYFFETSKGLTITKENLSESGIPVISYGQVHSKYGVKVDSSKDILPFVSEDYLKYKQSLLNQGDYIFADTSEDIEGSGNFSTKLNDNDLLFAGYHTIIARLMNKENNDFRYFMYLFDSEWFRDQVRNSVSGVKVFSITQAILKNTEVIVPSALTEQKAIADFLDSASARFDAAGKLIKGEIDTLKAYKKSLIYEAVTKGLDAGSELKDSDVDWIGEIPVGWTSIRFSYLGDIKNGLTYSPNDVTDENSGTLVLRSSNIQNDKLSFDNNVYVNTKIDKSIMMQKDDILITSRNGSARLIGKNAIVEKEINATYGAFMMVFRANKRILPKFAYYLMNSSFEYYRTFFTTSTINQLTAGIFKNMEVAIPSMLTEQQKIADYLDEKTKQVDDIIKIKEAQLSNLTKQRKSLIYDVVTGKTKIYG